MKLRRYQLEAVQAVEREFESNDSTLVVLPTGCGKTVVFGHVIHRVGEGRVMVLAHREELIFQATEKIHKITGDTPEIEMASSWADKHIFNKSKVIVSSIQTQISGMDGAGRMSRFNPNDFDLVVVDEAHHAVAKSYCKVLDYYRKNPKIKILGVTATPDRADEAALGKVFQSVAYEYGIRQAINDGYLVPIIQRSVVVESLDLSHIKTTAGDLNGRELQEVIGREENLHGIADPAFREAGTRQTLVFADSVANAERITEIFNRHRPECARWVSGETPKDERRKIFTDFSHRKFQFLCNVGVATEGYDEPNIGLVVIARPTKSRSLYAQMVGRGTRVLPGLIDAIEDTDQMVLGPSPADQRRQVIANSDKPHIEIMDFAGNAGRHKLVSCVDILGGDYDDAVVERATKKKSSDGNPIDPMKALEEAKAEIKQEEEEKAAAAARRANVKARATYSSRTIDPFSVFDIEPARERGWDHGKELSPKQKALLQKQGIDAGTLTFSQGRQLINELFRRWNWGEATFKQAKILKNAGIDSRGMSKDEASKHIDQLFIRKRKSPDNALAGIESY